MKTTNVGKVNVVTRVGIFTLGLPALPLGIKLACGLVVRILRAVAATGAQVHSSHSPGIEFSVGLGFLRVIGLLLVLVVVWDHFPTVTAYNRGVRVGREVPLGFVVLGGGNTGVRKGVGITAWAHSRKGDWKTPEISRKEETKRQKMGGELAYDLVVDFLSAKGFVETARTLEEERKRGGSHSPELKRQSGDGGRGKGGEGSGVGGSRLEDLLEKSSVAHMFGPKKRQRVNLDAVLPPEEDAASDPANPLVYGGAGQDAAAASPSMATKIVGYDPCKNDPYGATSMPIYQVSTFSQPSATTFGEYDYTRSGNPTREALERQICELEGGHKAFAFSTGMAALSAVTKLAKSGEEIILNDDSYGGTYRLLSSIVSRSNIHVRYVDMSGSKGPSNLAAVISNKTSLVMLESPTNPMQRVLNLTELSRVAHSVDAIVAIDGTMMTPVLQQPLALGVDIVVHSATKFISGHSDVMAGIVVVKDRASSQQLYFYQNAEGTGLSPFDSWLLLRGVKTIHIRMERQQENCIKVAQFLEDHPLISQVHYVGLKSHPDYKLHKRQAKGAGSVLCFCTRSLLHSQHIVTATKLFKITVSFGSVNSLISLPGSMSHASIPSEVRSTRQMPVDLVRISVGIENADDLISDLKQAIESYKPPAEDAIAPES